MSAMSSLATRARYVLQRHQTSSTIISRQLRSKRCLSTKSSTKPVQQQYEKEKPSTTTETTNAKDSSNTTATTKETTQQTRTKSQPQGPITWKGLALTAALGTAGLLYYSKEREKRIKEIMSPKVVGRAAIGGPFELIDENGNKFTEKELLGRWTLVYFGFTMCPDICPAEMTKLCEALEKLEKRGRKVSAKKEDNVNVITPLFISIDPERDSPERSAEYARGFHPAYIGVSGSMEQVSNAAKKYRVYFSKDETPGDDYLVDHSIITYLMDPSGEFQEFYGKNASALEIASRIEAKILAWDTNKIN